VGMFKNTPKNKKTIFLFSVGVINEHQFRSGQIQSGRI
jgi:hypothetical protein